MKIHLIKDSYSLYLDRDGVINKKKDTENKINLMTEERDILDKTINVIKNLKSI